MIRTEQLSTLTLIFDVSGIKPHKDGGAKDSSLAIFEAEIHAFGRVTNLLKTATSAENAVRCYWTINRLSE